MKRRTNILLTAFVIVIFLATCVTLSFWDQIKISSERWHEKQISEAMLRYGPNLRPIDEVRLLHIEAKGAKPDLGTYRFPLDMPYREMGVMTIVSERILAGEDAQEVATEWRQLRLHSGGMAACFDPHHVIQFRDHGKIVCEVVPCFLCENTTLPIFPFTALVSFDSVTKDGSPAYLKFKTHVEALVGSHPKPNAVVPGKTAD